MNWSNYFTDVLIIGSRYLIIATVAFLIWYVLFRRITHSKKIQERFPVATDYTREIGFSILTVLIMSFIPALVLGSPEVARHTKFYTNINQHGTFYFILAFPVMAIMHHPSLFKAFILFIINQLTQARLQRMPFTRWKQL